MTAADMGRHRSPVRTTRPTRLTTIATVAAVTAVGLAAGLAVGLGGLLGAAGIIAIAGCVGFLLTTRPMQWGGLFVLVSLFPLSYLRLPQILLTVTPWAFLLALMFLTVRTRGHSRVGSGVLPLLAILTGWYVFSTLLSQERFTSVGWLFSFLTLVVMPIVLVAIDPRGADVIRRAWVYLGGVLGVYAIVETFVLHRNPLMGVLFDPSATAHAQWSVYRATTTLGHPLNNGMYFSVGVVLALGMFLAGRNPWILVPTALNLAGLIASGSRAGLAAVAVGSLVLFAAKRAPSEDLGRFVGRRLLTVVGLIGGALVAAQLLAARLSSYEGALSGEFRLAQIPVALDAAANGPLQGVGPGVASLSNAGPLRAIGGAGAFESYWLEVLVATGYIGLALLVLFLGSVIVRSARLGDWPGAAMVLAWLVNATTVNAFEGTRSEQFFLGFVLASAVAYRGRTPKDAAHRA